MTDFYAIGKMHHDKGAYPIAYDYFNKGANNNDIRCAFYVFLYFYKGYYVNKDIEKGEYFISRIIDKIERSAMQGDKDCIDIIAYCKENGLYNK